MASVTSGEMADCDWLRSNFSGPLFSRNGPPELQKSCEHAGITREEGLP
jgi:hypothetical protein